MPLDLLHKETTEKIIGCFYNVYNSLGYGFLEKVYENALRVSLQKVGLQVQQQKPIIVSFEDEIVGEYFADLLVDEKVIIELKACDTIASSHEAQLVNYLRATKMQVGLVLNFGPKPEFSRKVCSN